MNPSPAYYGGVMNISLTDFDILEVCEKGPSEPE
jgi:hypothetical protein